MKILAIEMSSARGSVALFSGETLLREIAWQEDGRNRGRLFHALESVGGAAGDIDRYIVGRGPGAFSALRVAFSAAAALAAPAARPVTAVNSAESIVRQLPNAQCVAVVGDARRERVWLGVFRNGRLEGDFELVERDRLEERLPPEAVIAGPDAQRLAPLFASFRVSRTCREVYPRAADLGPVALQRAAEGLPEEPCEPLYLHPPVFVEPRFPE